MLQGCLFPFSLPELYHICSSPIQKMWKFSENFPTKENVPILSHGHCSYHWREAGCSAKTHKFSPCHLPSVLNGWSPGRKPQIKQRKYSTLVTIRGHTASKPLQPVKPPGPNQAPLFIVLLPKLIYANPNQVSQEPVSMAWFMQIRDKESFGLLKFDFDTIIFTMFFLLFSFQLKIRNILSL